MTVGIDVPLGQAFAEALAGKDFQALTRLLHPEVDFRALTPRRNWEAAGPEAVIDDILTKWFEPDRVLERLVHVETDAVADRHRVAYRFHGHDGDGPFVIEQQAYYTERDGLIDWVRLVCSGFRPRAA